MEALYYALSAHDLCLVCCERYPDRLDVYCLGFSDLDFDCTFQFLDSFCDPV